MVCAPEQDPFKLLIRRGALPLFVIGQFGPYEIKLSAPVNGLQQVGTSLESGMLRALESDLPFGTLRSQTKRIHWVFLDFLRV